MIGPGRPLDTDRYFVICANVLGGCMGTTGPVETNPATGQPYGLSFPVITIGDMVRVQALLLDHLGIERLFCVLGGSMGGMQVLEWAARYPERVFSAVPIASAARHSAQNIAFHEVGRQAIMADPDWQGGNYLRSGRRPTRGLSVARMAAHITYLSEAALHRKFGRALQDRTGISYGFEADFQVESYLRHQGISFVDRFDANSYLYITRAMDYFDLAAVLRRRAGQRLPRRRDALLRDLVQLRLAVSDRREPRAGAGARPRSRPTSRSARSRPTAAMTPSCSTSPSSTACSRASSTAPPRNAGCAEADAAVTAEQRPAPGPAPDRGADRAGYAGARRRLRRRRAARLSRAHQGRRRARHRAQPRRACTTASARASRWCRATPTPTSRSTPTARSTT